jgi:hypothetical protein
LLLGKPNYYSANGLWALDYDGDTVFTFPGSDKAFFRGRAGDIPVIGDWSATGSEKLGIFRNGLWALDSSGDLTFMPGTDQAFLLGTGGGQPRYRGLVIDAEGCSTPCFIPWRSPAVWKRTLPVTVVDLLDPEVHPA